MENKVKIEEKGFGVDWCIACADAGCILTKRKNIKYRLFTYSFIRIMKDVLMNHKENEYFYRLKNQMGIDKKTTFTNIWILDEKFYQEYIKNTTLEDIVSKVWFNPKYWTFMRHLISDSYTGVNLWKNYTFKVWTSKSGDVYFMFGNKKRY